MSADVIICLVALGRVGNAHPDVRKQTAVPYYPLLKSLHIILAVAERRCLAWVEMKGVKVRSETLSPLGLNANLWKKPSLFAVSFM